MDLLCYDDIKYYFLKKSTNATYATNIFLKILNVKDVVLCVVLHVSIDFFLVTITAAPCVGINGLVF